jgi:phospholipase C
MMKTVLPAASLTAALSISMGSLAGAAPVRGGPAAEAPRRGVAVPARYGQFFGNAPRSLGPIQHVVIIMQENRSVDNLFNGFPGANTVRVGMHLGASVPLTKMPLGVQYDPGHTLYAFKRDYDKGRMDGFLTGQYNEYAYVDPKQVTEYWDLAKQYAFSDNTFASNIDASFTAHQFLVAAQAGSSVDFPVGTCSTQTPTVNRLNADRTMGPPQEACFDYKALPDELTAAGLTWRYYAAKIAFLKRPIWTPTDYIYHLNGNPNVIAPETRVLTDISHGQLANVTWITPSLPNSDHAGPYGPTGGPGWVASIVNAIGKSPMWKSTVIFISWDEWGGWYDHVTPPYKDAAGLGMRVPMIVVSPFAKRGYVTHTQYETTSMLRFVENNFGLAPLTAADQRATDPALDMLDFGALHRAPFRPIAIKHQFAWAWVGAPPDEDN